MLGKSDQAYLKWRQSTKLTQLSWQSWILLAHSSLSLHRLNGLAKSHTHYTHKQDLRHTAVDTVSALKPGNKSFSIHTIVHTAVAKHTG